MSNTVTITAKRWRGGWELWAGDDCWTQVATLAKARQQVVDYLDTMDEAVDHSDWQIAVVPELGSLGERVADSKKATEDAAIAAREAARQAREVARELRAEGYSVSDSAAILGVSRGRVSQLVAR